MAKTNQWKDWNLKDLEKSLKSFKNNKSRDEHGHTYELLKYGGKDLKLGLLILLNKVKKTQYYPTIVRSSNISSIWKKKGEKNNLDQFLTNWFIMTTMISLMQILAVATLGVESSEIYVSISLSSMVSWMM